MSGDHKSGSSTEAVLKMRAERKLLGWKRVSVEVPSQEDADEITRIAREMRAKWKDQS